MLFVQASLALYQVGGQEDHTSTILTEYFRQNLDALSAVGLLDLLRVLVAMAGRDEELLDRVCVHLRRAVAGFKEQVRGLKV